MEDKKEIDLLTLGKEVIKHRKKMLIWALCGALVGVVIAISIPNEYNSKVKIVSEGSNASGALSSMGGLASMMGVNLSGSTKGGISEEVYPEIMRSTPFLNEFRTIRVPYKGVEISLEEYLNKHEKKAWWSYISSAPGALVGWVLSPSGDAENTPKPNYTPLDPSPEQRTFESKLLPRITSKKDTKTGILELSVRMQDPMVAAIVADSLTVKLRFYMLNYFTSKARKDLESNTQLLAQARQAYYTADSLYAAAVDRNQNLISKSAQVKLDRLQNERNLANTVYQQLATQVEMNKIKVQEDTPIATVIEPARVFGEPASPRRMLIIIGLAVVGAFLAAGIVVVRQMTQR